MPTIVSDFSKLPPTPEGYVRRGIATILKDDWWRTETGRAIAALNFEQVRSAMRESGVNPRSCTIVPTEDEAKHLIYLGFYGFSKVTPTENGIQSRL